MTASFLEGSTSLQINSIQFWHNITTWVQETMFPFPYPPEQTQYVVNVKIIGVSTLWKFYALHYTEIFITYRSEGRNNNQPSALPSVSQTSSSLVWLERWLEAICGRCWVDNFLKHAWLSSKDYMTMWKGLGGASCKWWKRQAKEVLQWMLSALHPWPHVLVSLAYFGHTWLGYHTKRFTNNLHNQSWEASHRRQPLHSLLQ